MAYTDYAVPFTDATYLENFYYGMEYIPSIGAASILKMKTADAVELLADAFLASPNGSVSDIVSATYSSTLSDALLLSEITGGDEALRNWTIFSKYFRDQAPSYPPRFEYTSLILVFSFLAIVTTLLRVYSRASLPGSKLMLSDMSLIAGTVVTLFINSLWEADLVNLLEQGDGGLWNMSFDSFKMTQVYATIEQAVYHVCILFLKSSILLFYLQFYGEKRVQRWITVTILILSILTNLAGFFFMLLECQPVNYWNHWLASTCNASQAQVTFALGILNIFTDLMIWLTALPTVWVLARTWRKKLLAMLVICSGLIACIASGVRAYLLWGGNSNVYAGNMSDFNIEVCTLIETNLMVVCYNVPAMRALINYWISRRADRTRILLGQRPSDIEATYNTYDTYNGSTFHSHSGDDIAAAKCHSPTSTESKSYPNSYPMTYFDDRASWRSSSH